MKRALHAALALALFGWAGSASAQTCVSGNITTDTVWSGEIVMEEPIFVTDDAVLTILPGTIVRGQPRTGAVVPGSVAGTPGALIVATDGHVLANGTPDSPIIFTSAAIDNDANNIPDLSGGFLAPCDCSAGTPGVCDTDTFYDDTPATAPLAPLDAAGEANVSLWGGLVVLGCAPTSLAPAQPVAVYGESAGTAIADCTTGGTVQATVEGLTVPGFSAELAGYGGEDPWDSSGSLSYLSVRHAGDEIGESNELNGITLAGVGAGTTFENIEVYANFDDGIEWFGGTVNGRNLLVAYVGDDMFDVDQSYTGMNQFLFGIGTPFNENDGENFGSVSGDRAGEWDGTDGGFEADPNGDPSPVSGARFLNMTILGNTPLQGEEFTITSRASDNRGVTMRAAFGGQLHNSVIVNTGSANCVEDGGLVGGGEEVYTTSVMATTCRNTAGMEPTLLSAGDLEAVSLPGTTPGSLYLNCDDVNSGGVNQTAGVTVANADITFDPTGNAGGKLSSALRASPIDPRTSGSTCVIGAVPSYGLGTENTAFRGAFDGALDLWTTPWSVLHIGGVLAD